jgi:hypothetical protein
MKAWAAGSVSAGGRGEVVPGSAPCPRLLQPQGRPAEAIGRIFWNICSNAFAPNRAATTAVAAVAVAVRGSPSSSPTSPMLLGWGMRPSSRFSPAGPSTEIAAWPSAIT